MEIPHLETKKLRLRPNRPEDFEPYASFYASERSHLRGGPLDRVEAWRLFAVEIGHWSLRGYGFWAVEEKATNAYCGQVGLWNPEGWAAREVGWMLFAEHEGKGIACEAALRARCYAYETLGWTEVASCISEGNHRSIRLAERMGARYSRRVERPGRPAHLVYLHPAPEAVT